jgi:hypothetical protein
MKTAAKEFPVDLRRLCSGRARLSVFDLFSDVLDSLS